MEVADGEEIPADLLLLAAEDQEGKCVVTTANLDGETNLKASFLNVFDFDFLTLIS